MSAEKKLGLFVFIDAFGWEILQQHAFLDDVLTTKAPLGTIFGYSSTCDPTILTGLLPRDHGHFSFFYYNPSDSPFGVCRYLSILPKSITRRGRVRRVMSRAIQRYYGYTGYFQIYNMPFRDLRLFDYSEKRDLYQKGGINSGARTIFDHLRDHKLPFYLSDWHAKEEINLASLEASIKEGNIVFAYLYWAHMDAVLHEHGTQAAAVDEKIQWYDRNIRRVLDLAQKKYDAVHVYIFSDHGMTNITEDCDLMAQINRLGLRFGKDFVAVYDSTMARFWFLNNAAQKKIVDVLEAEPRGRIMTEEQLAKYGCDFPDRKYGELFYLMNPGVLLCPSFMGETTMAGMHGYDPYDKDSVAMFASNTTPDPIPRGLDDLYGTMMREVSDV